MSKIGLGIIGLGYIFNEYYKVISEIKDFEIIGVTTKTNLKSKKFKQINKNIKIFNNIDQMMIDPKINAVIILVNPENSFNVIKKVIPYKKIFFTEKPAGLNYNQAKKLNQLCLKYKTKNMVGYNRRFYSIFDKGLRYISKIGLYSIFIEGHERFWNINKNNRSKKLLNNWIYANSSHTIDLLRFFAGDFKNINSFKKSVFHDNADQFSVILKSNKNILATYISNWFSPGGWTIKLFGNKKTIIFNPLENGYILDENLKKTKIKPSKYDIIFKPGFYKQMIYFRHLITKNKLKWPAQDISGSLKTFEIINKILK